MFIGWKRQWGHCSEAWKCSKTLHLHRTQIWKDWQVCHEKKFCRLNKNISKRDLMEQGWMNTVQKSIEYNSWLIQNYFVTCNSHFNNPRTIVTTGTLMYTYLLGHIKLPTKRVKCSIHPWPPALKFSSPGFFVARCISSRPKELLLTAATQSPTSIPDQLAPAAATQSLPANSTIWGMWSKLATSNHPAVFHQTLYSKNSIVQCQNPNLLLQPPAPFL